ncbi:MAG: hypothetical protein DDT21_01884 [Syntrophomonadaceae bacterium]|nr:hypothetical protein [Bacillota bacterium]
MYKFTLGNLPGNLEIVGEVDTVKEVFQQVHFWQGLPSYCPIDGTATVLTFKEPDDFQYYGLCNTGPVLFEWKLGQHKTKGTLFPKGQWTHYDGQSEIVVWENGRFTPVGVKFRPGEMMSPVTDASHAQTLPSGSCPECRAPEERSHATNCSKHVKLIKSLADVDPLDFNANANTAIVEEFAAIPAQIAGMVNGQPVGKAKQHATAVTPAFLGFAEEVVEWAKTTHRSGNEACSEAQYGYLVSVINKITGDKESHTAVLSALTGRLTTHENRVDRKLAGELLDYLPETKSVKNDDGTKSQVKNDKYRPTYVAVVKWVAGSR